MMRECSDNDQELGIYNRKHKGRSRVDIITWHANATNSPGINSFGVNVFRCKHIGGSSLELSHQHEIGDSTLRCMGTVK